MVLTLSGKYFLYKATLPVPKMLQMLN